MESLEPRDLAPAVADFLRQLGGPAFIRVPGRDPSRTRAVATLLHGNEPSGVRALHAWLRSGAVPAVNAVFLIGSVATALASPLFSHRALPGRPDLNRCFGTACEGHEAELAKEALAALRQSEPEALVDLHNTTGQTPAYGVGSALSEFHLGLVSLFAARYVHSDLRIGALVEATENDFPSATIECGRAGDPSADAVARSGLERYLSAAALDLRPTERGAIEVLGRPVRVRVRAGVRVAFDSGPVPGVELTLVAGVDQNNWAPLPPGGLLGWLGRPETWPITAEGSDGTDVSRDLFAVGGNVLRARLELIPIMFTKDPEIAVSDCLFYAVQRVTATES
jgi:hypothetical protein